MNPQLADQAQSIADSANNLAMKLHAASAGFTPVAAAAEPFIFLLTIFLLACFVGYYVVWNVTPALHSPLMAVTNGISSVIIVGAMLATGLSHGPCPLTSCRCCISSRRFFSFWRCAGFPAPSPPAVATSTA